MPVANVNGYKLNYFDDDFVDPWAPREVVFINHYGYGSARLYYKWVPLFASEYRVLRLDRRGFGDSEAPPFGYRFSTDDLIGDFRGFLDAVRVEKVHFVGDRFAGSIGALFAALHPERVSSLTMIASPCDCQRLRGIFEAGAESVLREGTWLDAHKAWSNGAVDIKASPEAMMKALFMREEMAKIPAHVLSAFRLLSASPGFTIAPILKDIKAPTLMITPEHAEPLLTKAEQDMMRTTIPDCRQIVIKDCDRDLAYDKAELCAGDVLEFIRKHSVGRVRADTAYDVAKNRGRG